AMVKVGRHRPGGRVLALVHVPDAVRVLEGDDGLIGAGNPIAWMIVSLALAAPGRGQVAAPRRGPSAREHARLIAEQRRGADPALQPRGGRTARPGAAPQASFVQYTIRHSGPLNGLLPRDPARRLHEDRLMRWLGQQPPVTRSRGRATRRARAGPRGRRSAGRGG